MDISEIELPEQFTYPFNYIPHPISIVASAQLQNFIAKNLTSEYSFGIDASHGYGKMFGVLVVQNIEGELGFLAAFSGKIGDKNIYPGFVPPIFDMLKMDGFFKTEELEINKINQRVVEIENSKESIDFNNDYREQLKQSAHEINALKDRQKWEKTKRAERRAQARANLSETEYELFQKELDRESENNHYEIKHLRATWNKSLAEVQGQVDILNTQVKALKEKRKAMSAELQNQLFDSYSFLNAKHEYKSLKDIFEMEKGNIPPSGSGECCAPKLLQYAYQQHFKPIALSEFWYGKAPSSEIRKHGQFYPSCRNKCFPILTHMMIGLDVEENTMMIRLAEEKNLEIFYEDEFILVIHKPCDFLSVPGANIQDSVYARIKERYPLSSGPLIVHRLDMSTSGLLLIALTKKAHYHLQRQFENRTIKKRYVAILNGILEGNSGEINLPLRVDLDDRPRQLVDFDHGKTATTKWEVVERRNHETKVNFYPMTGRTHQLRVHAAHSLGLNTPIKGDDLYGSRSDRLYLHAEEIEFIHPITEENMKFSKKAEF